MHGTCDLTEAIRRLQAFEAAGADLLYIPVPPGPAELKQIVACEELFNQGTKTVDLALLQKVGLVRTEETMRKMME